MSNSFIILTIILVNSIILVLSYLRKPLVGADHYFHSKLTLAIKKNKNRFVLWNPIYKEMFYPQLYHWLISFLPQNFICNRSKIINIVTKICEIILLNFFLFMIKDDMSMNGTDIIWVNLLYNIQPFNYLSWNAKNNGLSARGLGVIIGQIYLYLIVLVVLDPIPQYYIAITITIFLAIITSQFSTQLILLTLPFISIILNLPWLIGLFVLAILLFYVLMPQIAKKYFVGQYNHKRNYALFLSGIFILKNRPSIYRDFVYDFWVKLRKGYLKGMLYIYTNPVIETLVNLPLISFVIFFLLFRDIHPNSAILVVHDLVIASICLFVLTSFRWTRFLGEPQRYFEFFLPLFAIAFVIFWSLEVKIIVALLCIVIAIVNIMMGKVKSSSGKVENLKIILDFFNKNENYRNKTCASNDYNLTKFLPTYDISVVVPDISAYYKNASDFKKMYYKGVFRIIAPETIKEYITQDEVNMVIINKEYYSEEEIPGFNLSELGFMKDNSVSNYELYLKKDIG